MTAEPAITPAGKLRCATSEVHRRRHAYDRMVSRGEMTRAAADLEIATMSAIADDYRAQVEADQHQLFRETRDVG